MAGSVVFRLVSNRTATYCMTNVAVINMQRREPTCVVRRMKHWDPKFRSLRAKKVIKIALPDFDEIRREERMSPEEIKAKLKEKGIAPPRKWNEKPIFISCSGGVFEPYVPPEGDGKITLISTPGVKQKYEVLEKKSKSYLALRKIRNFEYEFDVPSLAEKAQGIYIEAHNALVKKDEDKLHELVTEKCFQEKRRHRPDPESNERTQYYDPLYLYLLGLHGRNNTAFLRIYKEMMEHISNKSLIWKFVQSLQLPHVVHIRCQDILTKNNVFAQATVRFHSQQSLAVYDRFGRLMYGDENRVKDVLEYVVFEKHLSNENGQWRIHAKIIPDWLPPKDNVFKTFRQEDIIEEWPISEDTSKSVTEQPKDDSEMPPAVVSA